MVAIVIINEKNGAGENATDKTSGTYRFKTADDATVDSNNPIGVPGAGSSWSFQKFLRLNFTGTFTNVSNLRYYTDGSNGFGTGVLLWAQAVAVFATPVLETGSAGYLDAFSYTSGAPLSLGAGPFTGAGDNGLYLQEAMEVQSTATQGALPAEVMTWVWDEI